MRNNNNTSNNHYSTLLSTKLPPQAAYLASNVLTRLDHSVLGNLKSK